MYLIQHYVSKEQVWSFHFYCLQKNYLHEKSSISESIEKSGLRILDTLFEVFAEKNNAFFVFLHCCLTTLHSTASYPKIVVISFKNVVFTVKFRKILEQNCLDYYNLGIYIWRLVESTLPSTFISKKYCSKYSIVQSSIL